MGIRGLQTCGGYLSNSASAPTASFPANVAAGNLIVVCVSTYNGSSITPTVTDSLGNTYTQAGSYSGGGTPRVSIWYAKNITGGACTITVTPSATSYTGFYATEYSGADTSSPLDSTATNTGTSTTLTTGSVTVGAADEMVVGVFGFTGGQTSTGINCGMRGHRITDGIYLVAADLLSDASVAVNVGDSNSVSYCAVGASFKAAAGGGGSTVIVIDE